MENGQERETKEQQRPANPYRCVSLATFPDVDHHVNRVVNIGTKKKTTILARSSSTFSKREKEKKRIQKQKEKAVRKEERKANAPGGGLDNMMAYVDENGVIVDTPPDPNAKIIVDASEIVLGIPPKEEGEEDAPRMVRSISAILRRVGFIVRGYKRVFRTRERHA